MFNFIKNNDNKFFSPCTGTLTPINKVTDDVFASKMLGDGYAVIPSNGTIVSPVVGVVNTIFPTKHAIGIQTKKGDEVLVHMGIDTVELAGKPFDIKVKVGEKVSHKTELAIMDLELLKKLEKEEIVIVVYTNRPSVKEFDQLSESKVMKGEQLGEIL